MIQGGNNISRGRSGYVRCDCACSPRPCAQCCPSRRIPVEILIGFRDHFESVGLHDQGRIRAVIVRKCLKREVGVRQGQFIIAVNRNQRMRRPPASRLDAPARRENGSPQQHPKFDASRRRDRASGCRSTARMGRGRQRTLGKQSSIPLVSPSSQLSPAGIVR